MDKISEISTGYIVLKTGEKLYFEPDVKVLNTAVLFPSDNFFIRNRIYEEYKENVVELYIGDSVECIENGTFEGFRNLERVYCSVKSSLRSIGLGGFALCSNLKKIDFPKSLVELGPFAFTQTGLEEVNFRAYPIETKMGLGRDSKTYVKKIGEGCFCNCSNLKGVYLPDELETIEEDMFTGCEKLEWVSVGNKLTYIKEKAFEGCSNLRYFHSPLLTLIKLNVEFKENSYLISVLNRYKRGWDRFDESNCIDFSNTSSGIYNIYSDLPKLSLGGDINDYKIEESLNKKDVQYDFDDLMNDLKDSDDDLESLFNTSDFDDIMEERVIPDYAILCRVGEKAKREKYTVKLESIYNIEEVSDSEFPEEKETRCIGVDILIENLSEDAISINQDIDFVSFLDSFATVAILKSNTPVDSNSYLRKMVRKEKLSGVIIEKGIMRGTLCYELPRNWEELNICLKGNMGKCVDISIENTYYPLVIIGQDGEIAEIE